VSLSWIKQMDVEESGALHCAAHSGAPGLRADFSCFVPTRMQHRRRSLSFPMSSSGGASVASLNDVAKRWNLAANDVSSWRSRILSSKTSAAPPKAEAEGAAALHDPLSREAFLDTLRLRQQAAEARVARMREALENPAASPAAAAEDSSGDDEEEDERGDEKHAESDDDEESSEDEDDEEREYENELEYYVHELLCVDAISHDPPSGSEGPCPYCRDGRKSASELACSTCAFVRGVCASCRKVVVLRTLEDPAKGAAVCMALLTDTQLLCSTLQLDAKEDAEEVEAIRGQITFMLDAYFDKAA